MLTLPNGNPVDEEMLEIAMEDSDLCNSYFLNTQTGEVTFFSDLDDSPEEREQRSEEMDSSGDYVRVDRIPSYEVHQWMQDFVVEVVEPQNERLAETLSNTLRGKGSFRRFKDGLQRAGDKWTKAWYRWKDDHLHKAMEEWFTELALTN